MTKTLLKKDETPTAATIGASDNVKSSIGNNVMNTLTTTNQVVTMSSREIAELTGKNKADVHVDVWNMLSQLYSIYKDDGKTHHVKNQQVNLTDGIIVSFDVRGYVSEFNLDRYHTEVLVTGYDLKRRAAVIKRWYDLETGKAKPSIDPMVALNDPAFLRDALISYTEKVMHLEHQVEEMKPDVDALTRIAKSEGSLCVTDAAKQLQIKPKSLFDLMSHSKWIYRRLGTAWIAYQDKIQQGLLEHKVTVVKSSTGEDKQVSQVRVTAKGLSKLAKLLSVEVAA
ncbi:phage antirepressor KilAC domain-containing protein [Moellerella wisconsensis]|uniref:phage antirepressor KilAC domain-containing protein n=1 Tax=Moellerella wisconsensis TaxID=158849 RepID=UPI001F4E54AC|nr:phage antirepressor KilAC domain-containing protein [Moellerella wisconsensis]UNH25089.1 phage regulatory protein/antirepressor Ant [Moellerella wisconsensis]